MLNGFVTFKATPIKCLYLDDNRFQQKLESWLYIDFIFYTLFNEEALFICNLREGHQFIGYFGEEAPFYWPFERGGNILLRNFGRWLGQFFFINVQNYTGGWLGFQFMVHALPGGLVI